MEVEKKRKKKRKEEGRYFSPYGTSSSSSSYDDYFFVLFLLTFFVVKERSTLLETQHKLALCAETTRSCTMRERGEIRIAKKISLSLPLPPSLSDPH